MDDVGEADRALTATAEAFNEGIGCEGKGLQIVIPP